MKTAFASLLILLSTGFSAAQASCLVAPVMNLDVRGAQSVALNWTGDSEISNAFKNSGYTPGDAANTIAPGEKMISVNVTCGSDTYLTLHGSDIRHLCVTDLMTFENQAGKIVMTSTTPGVSAHRETRSAAVNEAISRAVINRGVCQ